ncbi:hypothetical protein DBR11_11855 [Pedobacter sp. HMWF019]|uniref:hypothetical protein n=1 Tax=Pedobacter sp. HMWF019 TaxID=2056856 RepID=UPI000D3512D6|nr:hypothetical protein [Pedobacter sp. HMWF019]PTS99675.1 hypothetical protein DBR11_11855 [Pedobacter sp. HMWF019]
MRNKNIGLGQYDMVLAVSENKINFEIKQLLNRGIIDRKWQFLADGKGKYSLNQADQKFEEAKRAWLTLDSLFKQLAQLKADLQDKQDQLDDSEGEERIQLRIERNDIKDAIKELEDQIKISSKYEILVDAILDAPMITLLKDSNTEVLFKLPIKEGRFYYIDKGCIKECNLENKSYAFRVPIGKLRIDEKSMFLLDGASRTELREGGFNDTDFTVSSILLDFEKANVSQYSLKDSVLPADIGDRTTLQVAVINYFKNLETDKDSPYVLGYAINKKKLAEREKSLLYPTGTSYSTSQSNIARAPAFNFLMLTEKHLFPAAPLGGRIDRSLIEEALDKTSTVSGVIALDFGTFADNYLKEIDSSIENAFKDALTDLDRVASSDESEIKLKYLEKGINMDFTIKRKEIKNDADKKSISLRYDILIKANAHEEVSAVVGSVGVNRKFSTSGKYEFNGYKGAPGKIVIKLIASAQGNIEMKDEYTPPLIGMDTEELEYKSGVDEAWLSFSNIFNSLAKEQKKNTGKFLGNIGLAFKQVNFSALNNFSNKVVLPGSNVYTFKNIRLLNGKLDESDAVLFDISYAEATV